MKVALVGSLLPALIAGPFVGILLSVRRFLADQAARDAETLREYLEGGARLHIDVHCELVAAMTSPMSTADRADRSAAARHEFDTLADGVPCGLPGECFSDRIPPATP